MKILVDGEDQESYAQAVVEMTISLATGQDYINSVASATIVLRFDK